jgi:hypothetical protein
LEKDLQIYGTGLESAKSHKNGSTLVVGKKPYEKSRLKVSANSVAIVASLEVS